MRYESEQFEEMSRSDMTRCKEASCRRISECHWDEHRCSCRSVAVLMRCCVAGRNKPIRRRRDRVFPLGWLGWIATLCLICKEADAVKLDVADDCLASALMRSFPTGRRSTALPISRCEIRLILECSRLQLPLRWRVLWSPTLHLCQACDDSSSSSSA